MRFFLVSRGRTLAGYAQPENEKLDISFNCDIIKRYDR